LRLPEARQDVRDALFQPRAGAAMEEAGALLLAYSSDSEVLHSAYSQAIAKIKG
jgi:hypothetical protein